MASFGSDANPCTRALPCLTFFGALSHTDNNGEVNCLDAGPFVETGVGTGLSVTIDCAGVYQPTFAGFGAFQFNGGTIRAAGRRFRPRSTPGAAA